MTPANAASIQISAAPEMRSAAIVPWLATRSRSAPTITVWRDTRSEITPPTSTLATAGTQEAASTSPTSEADPPSSSTANASATATIRSPKHRYAVACEQQPELAQPEDVARRHRR